MSEPVGIIYPPPDLRAIVDSTAKYVAKNGGAFEEKIKREHRDKPKFSFLLFDDPFNAYYQHKVKEIRNQLLSSLEQSKTINQSDQLNQKAHSPDEDAQKDVRRDENSSTKHQQYSDVEEDGSKNQQDSGDIHLEHKQDGEQNAHELEGSTNKIRLKLTEYIQEMTIKLEEPPPLNYLATSAPSLMHMDCDIIKLTAQFIATHGRSFLLELVSREQNNSTFDFLKPQHGQFPYLTNLIMQYAIIQNQPLDLLEQLSKDATSQKHVLDKVKKRAEWNRMLELEQKKREEAEEKEKLLYSQIDWRDFVIVETIDYQPDEKGEYPPTTADQVGTRLLLQQRYEEQNVPEEMEIDMDVESDQGEESEQDEGFVVPDSLPPSSENIVIRKGYDPKQSKKASVQQDNYFVSPITNERIPVDKIHDHVKYSLSDPKYLEKKDQLLQEKRNEEAVFASGSQVYESLKSYAQRRTDIFFPNEQERDIGEMVDDDKQVQKKDDKYIWDGHRSNIKKKKGG